MAKCIVSGMAPGGGDGWVLMDEWDAVYAPSFDEYKSFYGSLEDSDFFGYSMRKIEVSGSVDGKHQIQYPEKAGHVLVCPNSYFNIKAPAGPNWTTVPINLVSTAFFTFSVGETKPRCWTYPENSYNTNQPKLTKLDGVAVERNSSYGLSAAVANVNLHVKVYAKK